MHFEHNAPYTKFLRDDGTLLRPHGSAKEGDAIMVQNWNSVVKPKDKVYVVGDLSFNRSANALDIFYRLNGEKVLIKGNHDELKLSKYAEHFKDVRGSHVVDNLLLTHIPVHVQCLSRYEANVHGHLHYREIQKGTSTIPDPRYFNVSVERINYTPIDLASLRQELKNRFEKYL